MHTVERALAFRRKAHSYLRAARFYSLSGLPGWADGGLRDFHTAMRAARHLLRALRSGSEA